MTKPSARYTFEEISQLAQGRERNKLELKNSAWVIVGHPGNQNKRCDCGRSSPIADKSSLRAETSRMLAKECGAFANSDGGTLVIGFSDNGALDSNAVPEVFENTTKKIDDWIADLLRTSLEPELEGFDCYQVVNTEGKRAVVVEIAASPKAPHQSLLDFCYYTRQEDSARVASHWLIEMIRNRRIDPRLNATLVIDRSSGMTPVNQAGSCVRD